MKEFPPAGPQSLPADDPHVILSPAAWEATGKALGEPPRDIPALRKLLTEDGVVDAKNGLSDDDSAAI